MIIRALDDQNNAKIRHINKRINKEVSLVI